MFELAGISFGILLVYLGSTDFGGTDFDRWNGPFLIVLAVVMILLSLWAMF